MVKIIKKQMPIDTAKEIENTIATAERLNSIIEYIAVCDHPEILEEADDEQIL